MLISAKLKCNGNYRSAIRLKRQFIIVQSRYNFIFYGNGGLRTSISNLENTQHLLLKDVHSNLPDENSLIVHNNVSDLTQMMSIQDREKYFTDRVIFLIKFKKVNELIKTLEIYNLNQHTRVNQLSLIIMRFFYKNAPAYFKHFFLKRVEQGRIPSSKEFKYSLQTSIKIMDWEWFDELMKNYFGKYEDDINIYNIVLAGFFKLGDIVSAVELFRQIIMSGLKPNLDTYNILLETVSKNYDKDFCSFKDIMHGFNLSGLSPNAKTWSVILEFHLKNQGFNHFSQLWLKIVRNGLGMSVRILRILVHYLLSTKDVNSALKIIENATISEKTQGEANDLYIEFLKSPNLLKQYNDVLSLFEKAKKNGRISESFLKAYFRMLFKLNKPIKAIDLFEYEYDFKISPSIVYSVFSYMIRHNTDPAYVYFLFNKVKSMNLYMISETLCYAVSKHILNQGKELNLGIKGLNLKFEPIKSTSPFHNMRRRLIHDILRYSSMKVPNEKKIISSLKTLLESSNTFTERFIPWPSIIKKCSYEGVKMALRYAKEKRVTIPDYVDLILFKKRLSYLQKKKLINARQAVKRLSKFFRKKNRKLDKVTESYCTQMCNLSISYYNPGLGIKFGEEFLKRHENNASIGLWTSLCNCHMVLYELDDAIRCIQSGLSKDLSYDSSCYESILKLLDLTIRIDRSRLSEVMQLKIEMERRYEKSLDISKILGAWMIDRASRVEIR